MAETKAFFLHNTGHKMEHVGLTCLTEEPLRAVCLLSKQNIRHPPAFQCAYVRTLRSSTISLSNAAAIKIFTKKKNAFSLLSDVSWIPIKLREKARRGTKWLRRFSFHSCSIWMHFSRLTCLCEYSGLNHIVLVFIYQPSLLHPKV